MTPGQLLHGARRRHGLSQQRLARRAGTTQSAISRIERDRVSPSVATLQSLLGLMGEELELGRAAAPIDYGHDVAMLRQNRALPASERLRRMIGFSNFVLRNRGTARRLR